ncbi:MAG TPA: SDR family oxidoreductase [Gemmatimonadales bacterium]|nr:SDR family oxidoreductase [Gemmatimonadales bacterium]
MTGGSTGIGFAAAEHAARAGARLVICARREQPLAQAAARIEHATGQPVTAVPADISRSEDVDRLFDRAAAAGPLAGVVHAAGVLGAIGPITDTNPTAWLDTVRINLFGTYLVTRAACRRLSARGQGGSVVLLSGGGAGGPFPNYTAYACSKIGVVRLTESVALEMSPHNIRVNCVAPGFVATTIHEETLAAGQAAGAEYLARTESELSKGGVPPSVAARAIVFLLSAQSQGITGRFLAAPYDGYDRWAEHLEQIRDSDLFTLRRIVPRDRGMDWQ